MSWGGKREGSGRRPDAEKRRRVTVLLSDAERARFKELGGLHWLRGQLSSAPGPQRRDEDQEKPEGK